MAEWKIIADECDLVENKPVEVIADGKIILLIKAGTWCRFEGLCPHQKARLVFGVVRDMVTLPTAPGKFRLSDGMCGPGWVLPCLKRYRIKVENGKIFLLLDD